jgi:transposase
MPAGPTALRPRGRSSAASIGYVRGNFWPGLQAEDLADLNGQARAWLDAVANTRRHGTTGVARFDRLSRARA